MKKLFIVVSVVIGVFVALIGYAIFNLNSIIAAKREYALARASDALGRQIQAGAIEASLGWGVKIVVDDVHIADDPSFSHEPFLQAKQVALNVELLPLLFRSVSVRSLSIAEPRVQIVRNRDGRSYGIVFRRLPADGRRLEVLRKIRIACEKTMKTPLSGVLVYDFSSGLARLVLNDAGAQRVHRHLRAS